MVLTERTRSQVAEMCFLGLHGGKLRQDPPPCQEATVKSDKTTVAVYLLGHPYRSDLI